MKRFPTMPQPGLTDPRLQEAFVVIDHEYQEIHAPPPKPHA